MRTINNLIVGLGLLFLLGFAAVALAMGGGMGAGRMMGGSGWGNHDGGSASLMRNLPGRSPAGLPGYMRGYQPRAYQGRPGQKQRPYRNEPGHGNGHTEDYRRNR